MSGLIHDQDAAGVTPPTPIGYFHCAQRYRYEQPRQGVLFDHPGEVRLEAGQNYEQALEQLDGFSRIWLIYLFHLNAYWAPMIEPPVSDDGGKVGVFASRSPHRPSRIGMTCVELVSVSGLSVHVRGSDILDGTPILDIKPYVPYCDSFPDAETGWLMADPGPTHSVAFSEQVIRQAEWLLEKGAGDLVSFARVQLSTDPLNSKRKRVTEQEQGFCLAYRTWRIDFTVEGESVTVSKIYSGYSPEELADRDNDSHGDKALHRDWLASGPQRD